MKINRIMTAIALCICPFAGAQTLPSADPIAIKASTIYTMSGAPIKDGVILLRDGKIEKIGPADAVQIPRGTRTLTANVATPGLIDAHTVVGLQGYLNEPREQDQLEKSAPMQPELRAADAFNGRERLLEWIRGFGVTTIHTGPAPGALMPGQTMVIKTRGPTVDDGMLNPAAMVCVTLGEGGINEEKGKSPGTRAKEIAMLRGELIKAAEYEKKRARAATNPANIDSGDDKDKSSARNLRLDVLVKVLHKAQPLLITAHRAQDILLALKLAKEFNINIILDGGSESYLMIDQIKAAGIPVILHPTMFRSTGERENLSMETAGKLKAAGIQVALQSAFEGYVPKTRVVLFEAAIAAANGMKFEDALAAITIDSAKILGIDKRVGSIEVGKDADIALFDGDPFEYTTHCTGTVIDGRIVSADAH